MRKLRMEKGEYIEPLGLSGGLALRPSKIIMIKALKKGEYESNLDQSWTLLKVFIVSCVTNIGM